MPKWILYVEVLSPPGPPERGRRLCTRVPYNTKDIAISKHHDEEGWYIVVDLSDARYEEGYAINMVALESTVTGKTVQAYEEELRSDIFTPYTLPIRDDVASDDFEVRVMP